MPSEIASFVLEVRCHAPVAESIAEGEGQYATMSNPTNLTSRVFNANLFSVDLRTYRQPSILQVTTSIFATVRRWVTSSGSVTHHTKLPILQCTHEIEIIVSEAQGVDLDRLC